MQGACTRSAAAALAVWVCAPACGGVRQHAPRRYALIVTAVAYVWPTTPLLQLRAALCVVLLAAMRLLNLAVPILYRDVVNTFRRGGAPAPAPTAHCGQHI